jgi:hypothetical protein
MPSEGKAPDEAPKDSGVRFPFSLKKVGEFIGNVIRLERDVAGRTDRCRKLEDMTTRMQRQIDEQTGQLKQLSGFLHETLLERIDTRAERAALDLIESIWEVASGSPPTINKLPAVKKRPRRKP